MRFIAPFFVPFEIFEAIQPSETGPCISGHFQYVHGNHGNQRVIAGCHINEQIWVVSVPCGPCHSAIA